MKRNVSAVCVCFVTIFSLVLELLKKCRVRERVGHPVELMVILIAKVVPPQYQMRRLVKFAPYEDPDILDCKSLGNVDSECKAQTTSHFLYYNVRIKSTL